jgi:hypothetical protein
MDEREKDDLIERLFGLLEWIDCGLAHGLSGNEVLEENNPIRDCIRDLLSTRSKQS